MRETAGISPGSVSYAGIGGVGFNSG